jgi:hypothetical protein
MNHESSIGRLIADRASRTQRRAPNMTFLPYPGKGCGTRWRREVRALCRLERRRNRGSAFVLAVRTPLAD